jgi:hypothetical protein
LFIQFGRPELIIFNAYRLLNDYKLKVCRSEGRSEEACHEATSELYLLPTAIGPMPGGNVT